VLDIDMHEARLVDLMRACAGIFLNHRVGGTRSQACVFDLGEECSGIATQHFGDAIELLNRDVDLPPLDAADVTAVYLTR
tara:strand:- start:1119 stop:1358 length:240 start_codon:yes stop_codon:yes gene_type:complete